MAHDEHKQSNKMVWNAIIRANLLLASLGHFFYWDKLFMIQEIMDPKTWMMSKWRL